MAAPRAPDPIAQRSLEPPPVPRAMMRAHRRYWRFNVMLISALMLIGFGFSFVVPLVARPLSSVRFAGFRLPFYIGAQGAIIVYLLLIAVYIVAMRRADRRLREAAAEAIDAAGASDAADANQRVADATDVANDAAREATR